MFKRHNEIAILNTNTRKSTEQSVCLMKCNERQTSRIHRTYQNCEPLTVRKDIQPVKITSKCWWINKFTLK